MFYHMNNTFQNTIFQIYISVLLMETVSFNGSRFFQGKALLLVKTNSFSGSHSFQWKPFLFSGSHSLSWKPIILTETIAPSGRHSFQCKLIPLVEAVRFSVNCLLSFQWKPFLQRKTLAFSGNNFFSGNCFFFDRWHFLYCKLFLLLEAIHFSGSHFLPEVFCEKRCSQKNYCPQLKQIFLEEAYSFQWKHCGSCFF